MPQIVEFRMCSGCCVPVAHGGFFVDGVAVLAICIFSVEGGIYLMQYCQELELVEENLVQQMREAGLPESIGQHEKGQRVYIDLEVDNFIQSGLVRFF